MPYFSIRDFPSKDGVAHCEVIEDDIEALWLRFSSSNVTALARHTNSTFSYADVISPLVVACANGNRSLVEWFLEPRLTLSEETYVPAFRGRVDHSGALEIALELEFYDILSMLLKKKYFQTYLLSRPTLFKEILKKNVSSVMDEVLNFGDRFEPKYLDLLFKYLCERGDNERVLKIIEQKIVIQITLDSGLVIASQNGNENLIRILLKASANPGAYEQKSIFVALENNRDSVVFQLLEDPRVSVFSKNNDFLNLAIKKEKPYLDQLLNHYDVTVEDLQKSLDFSVKNRKNQETVVLLRRLGILKPDEVAENFYDTNEGQAALNRLINRGPQPCVSIESELLWIEHYYQKMQKDLYERKTTSADSDDPESGAVRHEVSEAKKHLDDVKKRYASLLESSGGVEEIEKHLRREILTRIRNGYPKKNIKINVEFDARSDARSDAGSNAGFEGELGDKVFTVRYLDIESDEAADLALNEYIAMENDAEAGEYAASERESDAEEVESDRGSEGEILFGFGLASLLTAQTPRANNFECEQDFLERNFSELINGDLRTLERAVVHFSDITDVYQTAWRCLNPYSIVGSYRFDDDVNGGFYEESTEKLFTKPLAGEETQEIPSAPEINDGALNMRDASSIIREYVASVFLAINEIAEDDLREVNMERLIQSIAECARSNNNEKSAEIDKRGCFSITIREISLGLSLHPTLSLADSVYVKVQRQAQSYLQKKFIQFIKFCTDNIKKDERVHYGQTMFEAICMLTMHNKEILRSDPRFLPCYEVGGEYSGYTKFLLDIRRIFKEMYSRSTEECWSEIKEALIDEGITYENALPYLQYFLMDVGGDFVSAALGEKFLEWKKAQSSIEVIQWKNPFPNPKWNSILGLLKGVLDQGMREKRALKIYYNAAYQHQIMNIFYRSLQPLIKSKVLDLEFFSKLQGLIEQGCDIECLRRDGLDPCKSEDWVGYLLRLPWGAMCAKFVPKTIEPSLIEATLTESAGQIQIIVSPIMVEALLESSPTPPPSPIRFSSESDAKKEVVDYELLESISSSESRNSSSSLLVSMV